MKNTRLKALCAVLCVASLLLALGACAADDKPYQNYNLDKLVKLGEYKGVEAEFTTEDGYLDLYRDYQYFQYGSPKGIVDDPAKETVAEGDLAFFDYEGSAEGISEANKEGMKGKGLLIIGSGNFIPGFEDQMIGHPRDVEFNVNVTFPEDYGQEGQEQAQLNGKDAVFKCTVHKIGTESEEVTDDGIAGLTGGEYDTIAEFRPAVQEDLEAQAQRSLSDLVRQMNGDAAFRAAVEQAEFIKLPAQEGKYWVKQLEQQAEQQGVGSADELAQQNGYESARDLADDQVRHELFVFAVAAKEDITVTEEDLQKLLEDIRNYGSTGTDKEIFDQYGGKGRIIRMLTMDKVSDFLFENSKAAPAAS